MDDYKLIAIIPARGGSKRVPKKNIIKILGKPLLAYTIEKAINSKKFERVIVNSEDSEILLFCIRMIVLLNDGE